MCGEGEYTAVYRPTRTPKGVGRFRRPEAGGFDCSRMLFDERSLLVCE